MARFFSRRPASAIYDAAMNANALRRLIEMINGRTMSGRERAVLARFLLGAQHEDEGILVAQRQERMDEKRKLDDAIIAAVSSAMKQKVRRRHPKPQRSVIVQAEGVSAAVIAASLHAGVMPEPEQPSVLLQAAILNVRDKTAEGKLIECVKLPWLRIVLEIEANPDFLFEFARHHRKFEEFIASTYEQSGEWDDVTLTEQSGDKGRDVIVEKRGLGALRFVDQSKALSLGRLVTYEQVSALVGVLNLTDLGASKGIITTTTGFAPGVLESEDVKRLEPRLELRSGARLIEWLQEEKQKGERR